MARSWRWRGADVGEELALARRLREADVGEELASPHCVTLLLLLACSPVLSLSARLACASRLLFLPHSCSTGLANSLCQLFRASSSRLLRLPRSAAAACLLLVPRLATSPSDLAMPLRLATSTRHVASPTHLARLQLVQPAPSWGSVLVHALQLTRR